VEVERSPPRIIVCDIGLPLEDGYDFIAELRRRNIATPTVALTAIARPEDRVRSIKAGFASHLAKPVESAELLVTIGSLVGLYSA
jgi:CheY-like chemotaxis protein